MDVNASDGARAPEPDDTAPLNGAQDALEKGRAAVPPQVKAAATWLGMFVRTLKTCRLYDAGNPTVVRFREELAASLPELLDDAGTITYRFTAEAVTSQDQVIYSARTRDDNLAFAFYRDGVRGLTIAPGVASYEVQALVDAVLAVTGQNLDGDDLVTLLWEANLRHIDVDYIPAEGEAGPEAAPGSAEEGPLLPWPTAEGSESAANAAPGSAEEAEARKHERSEDWALGEVTEEVEATFAELDFMAAQEAKRFLGEFEAEHAVPPVTAALAIANACLYGGASEDDRRELARFLPRVMRNSIAAGGWAEARTALLLVRDTQSPEWSDETFAQEVLQPVSIARVVEKLDQQGPASVSEFIALAHELGSPAVDWLTLVLSESQARMTRQLVAEAIAVRVQEDPTRLAPWLSDPRWYVVRNVVHILGWVGGPAVVPMLQSALRIHDPRILTEVVTALQGIELRLARPVLIKALEHADTKLFCGILQQLSAARDPSTARYITGYLAQDKFLQRPVDERRAIYAAIASTGGDEVVGELEQALNSGNWFDRDQEVHRHAVARCLARIGTPRSLAALEAGAQSRRAPVRQACIAAMQSRMAA